MVNARIGAPAVATLLRMFLFFCVMQRARVSTDSRPWSPLVRVSLEVGGNPEPCREWLRAAELGVFGGETESAARPHQDGGVQKK